MADPPVVIGPQFARTMTDLHGASGEEWLQRLPAAVAQCAVRWSLEILPPFADLSYNYVAPAVRADGTRAVLKAAFPTRESLAEREALRLYAGQAATKLLASDGELTALLLERADPGEQLVAVADDDEATRIAASVMRDLRPAAPAQHSFPTIEDWGKGFRRLRTHFAGGTGPLDPVLVERADRLFAELAASGAAPVLLHGDLHHYNILSAQRRPWLAIDPKGVVGEPAYEVGALLRNPLDWPFAWPDPTRTMARRLDLLADELAFDRARLHGWGLAQAVLSAWWSVEDHGKGWEAAMACAAILASTKP